MWVSEPSLPSIAALRTHTRPQPPGGCLHNSATQCLARALPPYCGRGPGVTVSGPLAALVQPMVVYGG